ncbi:MAG TPA: redoxin domain-containing protein [Planctomycetota bacterium]|jgi:peroxiredoxin|nr:redoxin domain-containing protein [Planctomycetota bacterium]
MRLLLAAVSLVLLAPEPPRIGDPAPDFTLTDLSGNKASLKEVRGEGKDAKVVVVDFWSCKCPYSTAWDARLKEIHRDYAGKGVVLLAVDSNKSSYESKEEIAAYAKGKEIPFRVLLDPDSSVADLYGAKTTPHCFVVGKDGKIAYVGAVDSNTSTPLKAGEGVTNYLRDALAAVLAGKPVATPTTKEVGCSIKREKAGGAPVKGY